MDPFFAGECVVQRPCSASTTDGARVRLQHGSASAVGDRMQLSALVNSYGLNLAARGADLIFFLVIVATLSEETVGQFGYLMAVSAFAYIALNFGAVESVSRTASVHKYEALRCAASLIRRTFWLVLTALAVATVVSSIAAEVDVVIVAGLCVAFQYATFAQNLQVSLLRGGDRHVRANSLLLIDAVVKLGLLAAIWKLGLSLQAVLLVQLVAKLLIIFPFAWRIFRIRSVSRAGSRSADLRSNFSEVWMFVVLALLTTMQNRLDWVVINYVLNDVSLAYYSVANRIYEAQLQLVGIGALTMFPAICRRYANGARTVDSSVEVSARVQLFLIAGGAIAISLLFPFMDALLWGGRYTESAFFLTWLMPASILAFVNMRLYYELIAQRKEAYVVRVAILSAACQLCFNLWLIPLFGPIGAVVGMWTLNISNIALYFSLASTSTGAKELRVFVLLAVCVAALCVVAVVIGKLFLSVILSISAVCGSLLYANRRSRGRSSW